MNIMTDTDDGRQQPTAPPRISRAGAGADHEPPTAGLSTDQDRTQAIPVLRPSRFAAGTTYSGPATPAAAPAQQVPPESDTTPTEHIPAAPPPPPEMPLQQQAMPVTTPPSAPPPQQSMPVVGPPTAGPVGYIPPPPSGPPPQQPMPVAVPPSYGSNLHYPPPAGQPFELQPSHAMWGLTVLATLTTVLGGFGWVLVAGACGFGAWQLGQRRTPWPPDVRDLLARFGLAQPAPTPAAAPTPVAFIPFRPMSFPEIFTGAFKVIRGNWPTLVGIPMAILLAAGVAGAVIGFIVVQILIAGGDTLFGAAGFGSILVVFGIFFIVIYAIALPLDALLIALSVITTDKAVRGERIHMTEMFSLARQRFLPVTRLTLVFYGIFILTDIVVYAIVITAVITSSLAAGIFFYLVLLVANFVLGIMFSLAPIVVVLEQRGAMDSLKRSMHLVKTAFGRILGIHLLWVVCVAPILSIPLFAFSFFLDIIGLLLFSFLALAFLLAYVRTMQVLVYTDLRMRQENYEQELIADWLRNTRIG